MNCLPELRAMQCRFAPGERVTQLSVYPGPDNQGNPNARAGALTFATSAVSPLSPLAPPAVPLQACCSVRIVQVALGAMLHREGVHAPFAASPMQPAPPVLRRKGRMRGELSSGGL